MSASDYVARAEKVILELQKQEGKNYQILLHQRLGIFYLW